MTLQRTASEEHDSEAGAAGTSLPLSTILLWIGIFTISWERFANIPVGSYNLKVCTIAFALSLFLTVVDSFRTSFALNRGYRTTGLALVIVYVLAVAAVLAFDRFAALTQIVVVVLGAIVPFFATYVNLRLFPRVIGALNAFIAGGIVACFYGLYQLTAFYVGLPQGITYTAQSGGFGRISAFNYEAGYFGYFLILVIAAVYARAVLRGDSVNRLLLGFLLVVLLLANSRATFIALPLLFLLLSFRWPGVHRRPKLIPLIVAACYAVLVTVLVFPEPVANFFGRALTIFDPTEEASNAPRLGVLSVAVRLVRDHFWTGVGPGNFIYYAPLYGQGVSDDATPDSVIVNNIWLQALVDGGVGLLLIEVAFVVLAIAVLYRRATPAARSLLAGWIAVLLVSSVITSYFFDMKLWVILGMAFAVASLEKSRAGTKKF